MIIGVSEIWEGGCLNTEVCVMSNYTREILETISIKTKADYLTNVVIARERIEKLLLIAYPDSTIVRENYQEPIKLQADAKETKIANQADFLLP